MLISYSFTHVVPTKVRVKKMPVFVEDLISRELDIMAPSQDLRIESLLVCPVADTRKISTNKFAASNALKGTSCLAFARNSTLIQLVAYSMQLVQFSNCQECVSLAKQAFTPPEGGSTNVDSVRKLAV